MKTTLILVLVILSAAVLVGETAAQSSAPTSNQPGQPSLAQPLETMLVWHFPTPIARPRQCHTVWYPVQYWHNDGWGRTYTWVSYTAYYVCR